MEPRSPPRSAGGPEKKTEPGRRTAGSAKIAFFPQKQRADSEIESHTERKDVGVEFVIARKDRFELRVVLIAVNRIGTRPFGGQYRACDWLTARMGMYVDESPVSSDYLNPETPSMTKVSYTAGLSFRPRKYVSIDVAYCYVSSADPERTGSYPPPPAFVAPPRLEREFRV